MLRITTTRNKSKRASGARVAAASCACVLALCVAAPAFGAERPCVPARDGETFDVDFDAAELGTLARLVSCAAEVPIMFSPNTLSGKTVSVLAPRPVDVKTLVELFRTAVVESGLVMERRGAYYLIRPAEGGGGGGRTAPAQPPSKRRSSQGR